MLIFAFALIIGIIIHEISHYLAARSVKCEVSILSIGFGKAIYKKKIKKTIYQIGWLFFGGYVSLKHELSYSRSKYAFSNLPYLKKMRIVLAGCFTNIVFGLLIMQLGKILLSANLYCIGLINLVLGLGNLFPFYPCLDGSYILLVWLEKFYGKKKGYAIMGKMVTVGMYIINILNLFCIPFLLWYFRLNFYLFGIKIWNYILYAYLFYWKGF